MNSYELSRAFIDWAFENPHKVKPIHYAIYFFAIEHCNRLGWKKAFGLPSQMVMEAIGVKNWKTYSSALKELEDFGFIQMLERSKNQYSSNVVALVKNTKAQSKALDKALSKHSQKQSTKQGQSTVSINKQETSNNKPLNKEQVDSTGIIIPDRPKQKRTIFIAPELIEVQKYCVERQNKVDPEQWHNHYTANGWMVGKTKMKDWKAAVRTWEKNNFNNQQNATTFTPKSRDEINRQTSLERRERLMARFSEESDSSDQTSRPNGNIQMDTVDTDWTTPD